jgi:hypothetical protein
VLLNIAIVVVIVGLVIPNSYLTWRGLIEKIRDGYWG